VTLRALIQEVATYVGFPEEQCPVHETGRQVTVLYRKSFFLIRGTVCIFVKMQNFTQKSVQSPLVVLKVIVRKGGGFFYGKSKN